MNFQILISLFYMIKIIDFLVITNYVFHKIIYDNHLFLEPFIFKGIYNFPLSKETTTKLQT